MTNRGVYLLYHTESVRESVVQEESFRHLSYDYYDGLRLEYDEKGRGPGTGACFPRISTFISSLALCWPRVNVNELMTSLYRRSVRIRRTHDQADASGRNR